MTAHHPLPSLLLTLAALTAASPAAAHMGEGELRVMLLAEELEYAIAGEDAPVAWDASASIGGDWNRLRLRSEGEVATLTGALEGEAQLVYSRLVAAWWELHLGVRGDLIAGEGDPRGRASLVVGLDGVAPYWFEVEPQLFVSHTGDVSARLEVSHELYVTQRLIAESSVELDAAVQQAPRFGVGAGLGGVELGLRLRYELMRELAPYLGITGERAFFETARLRRDAGEAAGELRGVVGIRAWF